MRHVRDDAVARLSRECADLARHVGDLLRYSQAVEARLTARLGDAIRRADQLSARLDGLELRLAEVEGAYDRIRHWLRKNEG